ncbi:MAG: LysR family transcriptional regulator [Comamonas sp.]
MDLRRLNYFMAVAQELNFSRAAERLHISQPPLSQQIQALEAELGVVLFERSRRSVALTQAGRVFYGHACRITEHYALAKRQAQMAHSGVAGRIRLAFTASVPLFPTFPQLLQGFRQAYPHIEVVLRHLSTGEQLEALLQGEIDVGLLRPSPHLRTPEALRSSELWRDELVVAIAASHPLAGQDMAPIALDALAGEAFVLQPQTLGCGLSEHIALLTSRAGFTPQIAQESSETATTLALVAANLGVSIVPSTYRCIRPGGVHFRPLAGQDGQSCILAAMRKKEPDACVQTFIDLLQGQQWQAAPPEQALSMAMS